MCGAFEREKNDFWELKILIYIHMMQPLNMVKFTIEV